LFLLFASPSIAADYGNVKASLEIKSDFVVRDSEGPPAGGKRLDKFRPAYIFEFKQLKYRRTISFSGGENPYIFIQDTYGDYPLPAIQAMALKNFVNYRQKIAFQEKWHNELKAEIGKAKTGDDKSAVEIAIPWEPPEIVKGVIGEGKSKLTVTGSRTISFSGRSEWDDGIVNTGTFKQSKFPTLQMEQKSRFKITGTIGSKITVEVDQDSERYTDLANTIKLRYTGEEDEIIQSIEAGNTTLALPNSQFIGYSENVQGLFGIKTTARIGNLDLTMITSQDKGSSEKSSFNAGAQSNDRQIRDYDYLPRMYYWLGRPFVADSVELVSVELYTKGNAQEHPKGLACVSPNDSLPFISPRQDSLSEYEYIPFKRLDPTEFEVFKRSWYVVLNQELAAGDVLGAYIKYARYYSAGGVDTLSIGNLSYRPDPTRENDTTLVLQLLQHSQPSVDFESWERMWRNVYDLGTKNISSDGFELRIYSGPGGNQGNVNDREDQNGACYVTVLGLDNQNNNTGAPVSDCLADFNNTILDAARGHLVFPDAHPFDISALEKRVPQIYRYTHNNRGASDSTVYYLYVKTAQRAATYSLGRANIIEGSEVVKLGDGTPLKRGVDYNINYEIGQITFISQEAMNPGANVSVDFEYAPFFMPEKKTLFGVAGQYKLFKKSMISVAAMYRNETASDPRPRVGREPRKGFVWDSNFSFAFEPDFMTSMVDALPLIEADAISSLEFSGEIAQSMPNPNTRNQAFVDDFEGTLNYTDLTTRRGVWTTVSPPLLDNGDEADLRLKAKIWWYNPYDPVKISDIWPERDVRPQDDRQDVLDIEFFPNADSSSPDSSWAGIMRPLYTGMADQSLSKFIEFWYLPDASVSSGAPQMHINLGSISEDLNNNDELDAEDGDNNNVFTPEEDTGLDGLFDVNEPGYDPGIPGGNDPNGDDWDYDPERDRYDYSHINGTEGNRNDPDRLGRFDTEDINNNASLDRQNGYFDYSIDLNNPQYLIDSTTTGWKLLRIPIRDESVYQIRGVSGSADFTRIGYARLWFTGAATEYYLRIASFRLIGNKWQELAIAYPEGDTLRPGEKFEVTTKNTQENLTYEPPPGIAGELNRETGIREKEQSLVLAFQNMSAGHVAGAYWSLYQPDDYTQYQKLKMYVHGDSSSADSNLTFFFRMSQDGTNFYEYHTVLRPGWEEGNWVNIDFAAMTNLKYELLKRTPPESLSVADTTDGSYRIHGNPSLSQVKMFIAGVEVAGGFSGLKSGEVWLDEMRVTDIRRNSDFAGRLQATARFADFVDMTVSYQKTGADFFPLSAKTSSGATSSTRSARIKVNTDKLFPPSVGVKLPVNYSWQNTLSLPRLMPGSDIILREQGKFEEKTESTQRSYGGSLSFSRRTQNPFWNLTLNQMKGDYSFSRTTGTSPASPQSDLVRYQGKGSYDYTIRKKPTFKPFTWMKYLLIPKSIANSDFAYSPSKIGFSATVDGNNTRNVNQRGIPTMTRKKDLSLGGNISFEPFSTIRSNYSLNSLRDLTDERYFKFSANPSKLKLGRPQRFDQRFDTSFQPKLVSILDNKFSFSSGYTEDSDFKRNIDSTRTTDLQGSLKAEVTVKLPMLLQKKKGDNPPPQQKDSQNKGPKEDQMSKGESNGETDEGLEEERKQISPLQILKSFARGLRTIKPIRASVQKDKKLTKRGFTERPSWEYIFGFADNPHASTKSTGGLSGSDNTLLTDTYMLDTGLQPFSSLDISAAYNRRTSVNRRGTTDPTATKSVTFPDITVSISGLEKFSLFKRVARTMGLEFGYSKKVDETGNADTDEIYTRGIERRYSPLAGLNVNFSNNIRTTIRYDRGNVFTKNLKTAGQSDRQVDKNDNTLKLNITYSFTAPHGLKLPLLKKVKFDSQLSLSLDVVLNSSISESITSGRKSVDAHQKNTTIEPKLSYQFSRAITGGIRARWNDSDDKIQRRKHHVRELGIWTEIRF